MGSLQVHYNRLQCPKKKGRSWNREIATSAAYAVRSKSSLPTAFRVVDGTVDGPDKVSDKG
jgi:hypothetical protein